MSVQVFKLKSSSILLSILLILLLCLFFIIISARGLSYKFASAVEHEPEIHEAVEHEEERVVTEHEEEAHEDVGHETVEHGEAEGEAEKGIEIPAVVDAALFVAIAALVLGAGKVLGSYGKKTA
ncbi:MAG TPA: hypothetical protein ENN38_02500 [Actinobacteria bacterium]|nr:hypothetical protein [Actinomycetota bacterium]